MDEEIREGKLSPLHALRHRSPTFSKEEIKALVNIIEKYKDVLLNKSTASAITHAKDTVWQKVAKAFNSQGFKHSRSPNILKTKWDNLKKDARKLTKNLINTDYSELNELNSQIVTMLFEAEKNDNTLEIPQNIEDDMHEQNHKDSSINSNTYWDESEEKQSEDSDDGDNEARRSSRSLNFSPEECHLLLQCVKEEKKDVFCKESTGTAIQLKNSAWSRITSSFNKRSPQKRSNKVLRTKFNNMKRMAKNVKLKTFFSENNHKNLEDDNKDIKSESVINYKADMDSGANNEQEDDFSELTNLSNDQKHVILDPLSTILNGDSRIGEMNGSWSPLEHKEVVKLKINLLNYQMETAKIERKRIEDAIKTEAEAREYESIQKSLRLRAARLEVISAAMKFPPTHLALQYTPEEEKAQQYIERYNHT